MTQWVFKNISCSDEHNLQFIIWMLLLIWENMEYLGRRNIWGGGILGFCFECPYCASRNILFSVPFHNVLLICTLMKLDAPSRKFHCMNTLGIKTFFFGSLFCLVFLPCLVWLSGQFNKKWKTCAVRIIKWSRLPKVGYYVFQYSFQKYRFEIQIWWIRWAADISFQFTLLQWIGRGAGI